MKIEYHSRLDTHIELLPIIMESLCPIIRRKINAASMSSCYDVEFRTMFPGENPDKILTSGEMLALLACLVGRHTVSDCIALVQGIRVEEWKCFEYELTARGSTSGLNINVEFQKYCNRLRDAAIHAQGQSCGISVLERARKQKYNEWLAENQDNIAEYAAKWYMSNDDCAPLRYIAGKGLIDIIEIASIDGHTTEMSTDAAAHGQIDVVKWLHTHNHPCDYEDMAEIACNNGHLSVVEFLDTIPTGDNSSYVSIQAYKLAAVQSNVDILKWVVENNKLSKDDMSYLMHHAMKYGTIASVKYLHKIGVNISAEDVITAAGHGCIDVVQYACIRHITTNIGELITAAKGHVELSEWLDSMYAVKTSAKSSVINNRR